MRKLERDERAQVMALPPLERRAAADQRQALAPMPLAEALRLVVEDWADDPARQASVIIAREKGPDLVGLDAVREVYRALAFPEDGSDPSLPPGAEARRTDPRGKDISPPAGGGRSEGRG